MYREPTTGFSSLRIRKLWASPWDPDFGSSRPRRPPKKSDGWLEKSTMNEDVFPIENGDFPASHVRIFLVV